MRIRYHQLIPEYPVADVEEAAGFYCDVLGFHLAGLTGVGSKQKAWLRCGDVELVLYSTDTPRRAADPPAVLHLVVDNIGVLYERVRARVPVLRGLARTLFAAGEFAIQDTSGMVLHFAQPIEEEVNTSNAPGPV